MPSSCCAEPGTSAIRHDGRLPGHGIQLLGKMHRNVNRVAAAVSLGLAISVARANPYPNAVCADGVTAKSGGRQTLPDFIQYVINEQLSTRWVFRSAVPAANRNYVAVTWNVPVNGARPRIPWGPADCDVILQCPAGYHLQNDACATGAPSRSSRRTDLPSARSCTADPGTVQGYPIGTLAASTQLSRIDWRGHASDFAWIRRFNSARVSPVDGQAPAFSGSSSASWMRGPLR